MTHPGRHNISEAAKAAGVSRRTLQRHIEQGRVSSRSDEGGNKFIDTSELLRAYGNLITPDDTPPVTPPPSAVTHLDTSGGARALRDQLAQLERQLRAQAEEKERQESKFISQMEAFREESRKREDRLLDLLDRQTLLLTHIQDKAPEPVVKAAAEAPAPDSRIEQTRKELEILRKQNAYIIHTLKLTWWDRLLGKKYVVPNDR